MEIEKCWKLAQTIKENIIACIMKKNNKKNPENIGIFFKASRSLGKKHFLRSME
jgi:hypothetical protein